MQNGSKWHVYSLRTASDQLECPAQDLEELILMNVYYKYVYYLFTRKCYRLGNSTHIWHFLHTDI